MGGDLSALQGVGSPETSGEVAEAAKEAARVAEEEAAKARIAAQEAKEELNTALKRMQELEVLLGGGSAASAETIAKIDPQAAEAQKAAQALGSAAEQAAADAEITTLTADIDAIAKQHGAHGTAIADAATAVGLKLAKEDSGLDWADVGAVRAALLGELKAAGRVQADNLSAQVSALLDGAAAKLSAAGARAAELTAVGPNTREILGLKLLFYQRVQSARREAAAARGALDEKVAAERNSLESADAARQTAEAANAELLSLRALAEEQSVELAELKMKTPEEKQKLMAELQRKAEEATARGDKAKAVDYQRQYNRVAERMKNDENAKNLLAEQMESNERALKALEQSWEEKLKDASELETKRQAVLDKLGLGKMSEDIDDKTPHLVNLNEDPNLTDKLLYFLKPGTSLVGSDGSCDAVLEGAGIASKHAKVDVSSGADGSYVVNLSPIGSSSTFVNGQQLKDTVLLHHSDRVIFGARQVFRLVHVSDPQKKDSKDALAGVIDWDLAQQELGDALGKAINVKVDEEVKRCACAAVGLDPPASPRARSSYRAPARHLRSARCRPRLSPQRARGNGGAHPKDERLARVGEAGGAAAARD